MKSQTVMLIKASNGAEIVDATPEAEIRYNNMLAKEERLVRESRRKRKQKLSHKILSACGLL